MSKREQRDFALTEFAVPFRYDDPLEDEPFDRDQEKPAPSITAVTHHTQPSAWPRTALYGGSITLMAALLALGFTHARPTPRRRHREPQLPAPAWNRRRPSR